MKGCKSIQEKFTEYLDGQLTGREMQRITGHLDGCADCAGEWSSLRKMQASLARLGPVKAPKDLPMRIRVALKKEKARRRSPLAVFDLVWRNTVGPFIFQAAAGFASAVLLMGTVIVLTRWLPNRSMPPRRTSRWATRPRPGCFISRPAPETTRLENSQVR